ncbi:hypothetical protein BC938DRAFT_471553 [Jimgerdemannia flammicorona]|uniref:Complex 1 LYR protein domain-containing protein n=1 Tax=Jimgerdemannia flammicorona TaxID=994334 RepID=A0A433Q7V8_9FUNG|nr:hypothetical protein BC938DRAFT_471553 [Jimgerdemannia flammicorona]
MPYDRARTLSLYKQLLKVGKQMPSRTRQTYLLTRIRSNFRRNAAAPEDEYELLATAGESMLETLQVRLIQQRHLTALQSTNVLIPVDLDSSPERKAKSRGAIPSRFMRGPTPSWLRGKEEDAGR